VADIWYYADRGETKGPFAFKELIEVLAALTDPTKILVWRNGFEDWKRVDQVAEIGSELFRPPPLPKSPPPLPASPIQAAPPQTTGEPSVSAAEAGQFKNLRPDLAGIASWLILVAIGQVLGPLRFLVSMGEYYEKMDKSIVESFPIVIWGEAAMNASMFLLGVYTAVLFFRHSRKFPTFFIWEWLVVIALPFIDAAWVAISMAAYTGRNPAEFMNLEPKEIGQSIAYTIVGGIWVAYILRSKRVANTFVK
jgi:hypothetical protein